MAINFQKILKENIKVKTEIFTLLLEITKEFPLKTAFNVSLILLATFSEIIGIGLLIPFLEILLNNDTGNISSFSSKILILLENYNIKLEIGSFLILFGILLGSKHLLNFLALWQIRSVFADFTSLSRKKILSNLLNVKPNYLKNFSHGSLIDVINREATSIGHIYIYTCRILNSILQSFVYIGFSFFISWELSLFSLVVSIFVFVLLNRIVFLTKKLALANTITFSKFNKFFSEFLNSFKIIKIERLQKKIKFHLSNEIKKLALNEKRFGLYREATVASQNIIFTFFLLFGIFILLVKLEMSFDKVGLLCILFLRITQCFATVLKFLQGISAYLPLNTRVNKINNVLLKEKDLLRKNNIDFKNKIELKNINYSYSTKKVLKNLSLSIKKGDRLIIRGPSGVGKTTLLDIISGLLYDFTGEIIIDGKKRNFLINGFKKNIIHYVPQEGFLYNDTVINNITNKKKYTNDQLQKVLETSRLNEFINKLQFKFNTIVGDKGGKISGGQRQRIALARALFNKPRILILDEATSNIDMKTEEKIIKSIIKNYKLTLIIVSHRRNLNKFSNKVIDLRK